MSRGLDVLVVEDESVVLEGTRRILLAEGLAVEGAADADAALTKLRATAPRIVLSDLMLPGKGGLELLEEILRQRSRTPVVMITGYATLGNAIESFKNGVFDFLPKPFDAGELLAVVRRALGFSELDPLERQTVDRTRFARPSAGELAELVELLSLGQHAWAGVLRNGSVRIGAAESFRGLRGDLRARFPELPAETLQGNECVRLVAGDGLVHRLWAPLSGRIVDTHREWETGRKDLGTMADGWLLSIVPSDLKRESADLTAR